MNGGEPNPANALATAIARTYGFKGTAGGDVHVAAEVGRCATWFAREIRSESDLVTELRAGRFATVDLRSPAKT